MRDAGPLITGACLYSEIGHHRCQVVLDVRGGSPPLRGVVLGYDGPLWRPTPIGPCCCPCHAADQREGL